MTFDQIDFFMSCAACLNFSLAAKFHFVSVSTLSRRITSLEEELGVKLFERGYHGHSLTEAGMEFFVHCMNSRMQLNGFINKWAEPTKDKIVVGCYPFDNSFRNLVTSYSNTFSERQFGNIKVNFIPRVKLLSQLRDGMIDIALISAADFDDSSELDMVSLYKEGDEEYFLVWLKQREESFRSKLPTLSKYL